MPNRLRRRVPSFPVLAERGTAATAEGDDAAADPGAAGGDSVGAGRRGRKASGCAPDRESPATPTAKPTLVLRPRLNYKFQDIVGPHSFLRDNEFIRRGYRVSLSGGQALRSLFSAHNETMNVWTHLLGATFFVVLVVAFFSGELLPFHGIYSTRSAGTGPGSLGTADPGAHGVNMWCDPPVSSDVLFLRQGVHTRAMLLSALYGGAAPVDDAEHPRTPDLFRWLREHAAHDSALASALFTEALPSKLHAMAYGVATAPEHVRAAAAQQLSDMAVGVRERARDLGAALESGRHKADEAAHATFRAAQGALAELQHLRDRIAHSGSAAVSMLPAVPEWPIAVFLVSAVMCLGFSSTFHLLSCVDKGWYDFLVKLDYAGIGILIGGSAVPILYYGFFCRPALQAAYLTLMFVASITSVCITFVDRFQQPAYRVARMLVFVSNGLAGAIPLAHMLLSAGLHSPEVDAILWKLLAMGGLYIGGAMLYAARIPERWFPGAFDYVFSSHQIWHLFVFSAAVVHYYAVIRHFEFRSSMVDTCPPIEGLV